MRGTLLDGDLVTRTLRDHDVDGVIHIAGFKYAGVSVRRPLHTYEQNVSAMVTLLKAMDAAGVDKMVFSSSAATFGTPDVDVVTEDTPTAPESPYGETKLIGEWILRDAGRASGLRHTSLRYFNVVGSGSEELFDASPHNLFPLVFDMLYRGETPQINGDDYPTPDGTCVRDYIHVADLARAHVAAAQRLTAEQPVEPVYNLGSGDGTSVREIMTAIRKRPGSISNPRSNQGGQETRPASSLPATWRDVTWTGGCGIRSARWWLPRGRREAGPATNIPREKNYGSSRTGSPAPLPR